MELIVGRNWEEGRRGEEEGIEEHVGGFGFVWSGGRGADLRSAPEEEDWRSGGLEEERRGGRLGGAQSLTPTPSSQSPTLGLGLGRSAAD